jgi:microcystin-dependent protein
VLAGCKRSQKNVCSYHFTFLQLMDEFIGIIKLFGGNFAPKGWAMCNGQLLSIAQNSALFSILGTTYGGDGQTTFALPDLRSRVALGMGQGNGLSNYSQGEISGTETVTILSTQMPAHTHALMVSSAAATTPTAAGNFPAEANAALEDGTAVTVNTYAPAATGPGNPGAIGFAGGSQPLPIMQPYMAMNYIICLEGLYPSRN